MIGNLKENMCYCGRGLLSVRPRKEWRGYALKCFELGCVVSIFIIMRVFSMKYEGVKEGKTGGRNFLRGCGRTLERDDLDGNEGGRGA